MVDSELSIMPLFSIFGNIAIALPEIFNKD
jgi:hypothetical protein